ncbi:MAG: MCP four helix bundle domain-containing protein [Candidatus Neomarinimicrobiota bacterium]
MRLRIKILSGFLILILMLAIAGVWSIYKLGDIGLSVTRLLEDNYKSIEAGKVMLESLEREDSGVLLLAMGQWERGRTIIEEADSTFHRAYRIASSNITEAEETQILASIMAQYNSYHTVFERPIVGTDKEGDIRWYFEQAHASFQTCKNIVSELIALNDEVMFETANDLRNRAHRAATPGIVAIVSALVFALLFNFFLNIYFVRPILKINRAIDRFLSTGDLADIDIKAQDELGDLASAIQRLAAQRKKEA